MSKHVAIYVRVSTNNQDFASQEADLKKWAASQEKPVVWYKDKATGTTMDRSGMSKLLNDINAGRIESVVCWRLDRLGRTAKGLVSLFDDLQRRKINLISLKEGLDLSIPAGRLMANVLASVASFETEIRKERQMAGIAAAKAAGKTWGGSKKGRRIKLTDEHISVAKDMYAKGKKIAVIARTLGLCRPTIYKIIDGLVKSN
jgi:DNA invertase Pin-like site-specific DNA recombinase